MLQQKRIDFEVNFTRMKWCPKKLEEIPETMARAFEREVSLKSVQPMFGTDHIKEWPLEQDKDIKEFYDAPTMMREWIAEKLVKLRIPAGFMPKDFQPKKVKILAKGQKIAKFFGEDSCSTRTVECSLKLFDCGHFYLKQTLPGSGSPHWTIFEGRWHVTQKGVRLEYLLRYSWQTSRKPGMDFAVEAVKPNSQTRLAWDGETERQLNGNLPAVVGTEEHYWVELVREGEIGEATIRWNEEFEDSDPWKAWDPNAEKPPPKEAAEAGKDSSEKPSEPTSPPKSWSPPAPRKFEPEAARASSSSSSSKPAAADTTKPAAASTSTTAPATKTAPAPKPKPKPKTPSALPRREVPPGWHPPMKLEDPDKESIWPLYICFAIFVALVAYFMYSNAD
mmetsp:Transcript_84364/g.176582  ORF Transcript_84364/g.176582 Transcript_84364/m.176582 type:complete len:392 (+) Transcript_84364:110-1285(+)